jgi:hypothetical protein
VLILLGYLVVLGTVFGGYLMTGGSLGALYQPAELVIIAGAGIGSFIVGNNGKAIKGTLKALPLLPDTISYRMEPGVPTGSDALAVATSVPAAAFSRTTPATLGKMGAK